MLLCESIALKTLSAKPAVHLCKSFLSKLVYESRTAQILDCLSPTHALVAVCISQGNHHRHRGTDLFEAESVHKEV